MFILVLTLDHWLLKIAKALLYTMHSLVLFFFFFLNKWALLWISFWWFHSLNWLTPLNAFWGWRSLFLGYKEKYECQMKEQISKPGSFGLLVSLRKGTRKKSRMRVDTSASEDPRARPPADSLRGCCGDIHTLMEAGSRHGGGRQQPCLTAHPGCDGALTPPLTPTAGPRPLQGAFKRGRRKWNKEVSSFLF